MRRSALEPNCLSGIYIKMDTVSTMHQLNQKQNCFDQTTVSEVNKVEVSHRHVQARFHRPQVYPARWPTLNVILTNAGNETCS